MIVTLQIAGYALLLALLAFGGNVACKPVLRWSDTSTPRLFLTHRPVNRYLVPTALGPYRPGAKVSASRAFARQPVQ